MVSYSGIITYKNTDVVRNGVRRLPEESLLLETDAPFLTPVPHRGKPNESAYLPHTFDMMAELRAFPDQNPADNKLKSGVLNETAEFISYKENLKSVIYKNSKRLIGWKNNA
jgi:TatD DNase family protein